MKWFAPAKLNLFLHVLGRRDDGYHRLQTVFQLLDWCDEIEIAADASGVIRRTVDLPGVPEDRDLALRAARLLKSHGASELGCEIAIEKKIPIGAGLGGGSSDAAAVLLVLNRLWNLSVSEQRLCEIGLQLGADVPLFIQGRSAWAEGIGERLSPVVLPERWFVVVDPGVFVSTEAIFQAPELTRDTGPCTMSDFIAGAAVRNDLEPVARARYPKVGKALDWLGAFAPARMTGSGGCAFASFAEKAQALRVASQCPREFRAFAARGIDESPLRGQLV